MPTTSLTVAYRKQGLCCGPNCLAVTQATEICLHTLQANLPKNGGPSSAFPRQQQAQVWHHSCLQSATAIHLVTPACQLTCLALRSQQAISWEASIQMSNWLLAKDQRQHCCPTCCLGFKTDAELFVHLKHTEVHKVEVLQSSQLCFCRHAV